MTSTAADHEIFTHDYKFSFSIDQQSAQSSVQSTEERLLAFRTSRNVQRLFQEQLLITKCLKERIQSLEDRLDHEITLVFSEPVALQRRFILTYNSAKISLIGR